MNENTLRELCTPELQCVAGGNAYVLTDDFTTGPTQGNSVPVVMGAPLFPGSFIDAVPAARTSMFTAN